MLTLTPAAVARHRRRLLRRHRVRTARGALRFIDAIGFCFAFTGGPGGLPGLFDVLATRSIDRMWTWAWQWKDDLVTQRRAYYGKVIRRKPSYVCLKTLPAFYALSGNVGEPDDYLQAFREGRLSMLARAIYEHVLASGPISTRALRRLYVQRGESGDGFHRALDDLQARFLLAKVAEEAEWRNGFVWDAFHRWMPEVVAAAARLTSEDAAARVVDRYIRIVGAAPSPEIQATFAWTPRLVGAAVVRAGLVRASVDGADAWTLPGLWAS
ncbi:MAG: hypothetical protein QN120_08960 [Armatimonadota bacterium]|nr:hypothetical protein [Armatimonadota bacterium]